MTGLDTQRRADPSHDATAAHAVAEWQNSLDRLGRVVRMAPRFTDAIQWWAGFPLHAEQTAPTTRETLTETNARLFDLPTGTPVTRRDLHFASATAGSPYLAAAVTELVYEPRLGLTLDTRRALHHGSTPADEIVHTLHRAVWSVLRPDPTRHAGGHADPKPDDVALQAGAILTGAGRPVALTTDTVYWRLLTHRVPDVLPHYAAHGDAGHGPRPGSWS
ncbi:hypothetical protein GCM10027436_42950 [Actinophytocola sediminis]